MFLILSNNIKSLSIVVYHCNQVRVPPAVSVVWMALVGATLAVVWRFIPIKDEVKDKKSANFVG